MRPGSHATAAAAAKNRRVPQIVVVARAGRGALGPIWFRAPVFELAFYGGDGVE